MAVFRIDKTRDYTVMSNHHLRKTGLSLKAKGLLSLMLSLPEEWDYTTKGLAHICKDGVDNICAGVRELEEHGYVIRERVRFDDIYARLGSVADECLDVLQKDYDLSKDNAKTLFEHVWIHTFGIGALCATGMCDFSHEQIAEMLTQDFTAMMMLMKSGKSN